jgi:hypothetical protein
MAPDLAYAFNRPGFEVNAHVWPAAVAVALPLALMAARYIRWLAPTTFRQLPPAFGIDLRMFESLSPSGPALQVTAWSSAAGIATHIFWDGLTHTSRWGAQLWPWLAESSVLGFPPARVLQYLSHLGGLLVALYLLSRMPAPSGWQASEVSQRDRVRFWIPVLVGSSAGFIWGLGDFFAALIIKTSFGTAAGLGLARLTAIRRTAAAQKI